MLQAWDRLNISFTSFSFYHPLTPQQTNPPAYNGHSGLLIQERSFMSWSASLQMSISLCPFMFEIRIYEKKKKMLFWQPWWLVHYLQKKNSTRDSCQTSSCNSAKCILNVALRALFPRVRDCWTSAFIHVEFLASAFRLLKRLQIMFLAKEALISNNQATSSF